MGYIRPQLPSDVNETDEQYFDRTSKKYGEDWGKVLKQKLTPYRPIQPLPAYADTPAPAPPYEYTYPPSFAQEEPYSPGAYDLTIPTEQGGLGLAAKSGANAYQPQSSGQLAAQEFKDYFRALPVGMRLNLSMNGQIGSMANQFLQQRQALAQNLSQQEEQARQHDLQLLEKAMASPNAPALMESLAKNPNYRLSKQAMMMSKTLKDQDYGSLQAYQQFIPQEVQQRFVAGKLPYPEFKAWIDQARKASEEDAKATAKATVLKTANDTPAAQRTPYQKMLVEEEQAALELKQADIELKKQQAAKAKREAEQGPPDHSVLNRVHERITNKGNGGLPYSQGSPETQSQALKEYFEGNAQGRTNVMLGTPAPVKERTNIIDRKEFMKTGKLVLPPAGVSEGQLRSGNYTEISDKQKEAWGEIENSGTTLKSLFGMVDPLITAKTPAQAAKQYAQLSIGAVSKKNAAAATYLADSEAFSSRMARVFGSEVGVLTQGDVDRWKRALPTFGDTVAVRDMKKKVFFDIYDQSRAMAMKKIAGEDISQDVVKLKATLDRVDKLEPPSVDQDFNTIMGGK